MVFLRDQDGTIARLTPLRSCIVVTPLVRAEAYRDWLKQGISDDELNAIRKHLQQERAFGSKRFQVMTEKTLGRPVRLRRPGRPRHEETKPESI